MLLENEGTIKLSICQKCNGYVRAAILFEMSGEDKTEFLNEVFNYDLAVKSVTLSEYKSDNYKYCRCK